MREIIVEHGVEAQEVKATSEQVGGDQYPSLARAELVDGLCTCLLGQVRVDDVHVHTVVGEFAEELLRPLLALDEDQHRGLEALKMKLNLVQ